MNIAQRQEQQCRTLQPSRLLATREDTGPTEADLALRDRLTELSSLTAADLGLSAGSDKVWKNRFRSAANYVLPNLYDAGVEPSQLNALEVGSGTGAKSAALAPLFKSYVGVDLFYSNVAFSRRATGSMGIRNAEFHAVTASAMRDFLQSFGTRFDVIFLIAVIEHLTPIERIETLAAALELLNDGGFLYIGETPNRLAAADHHTFFLPYFDSLPPELAMRVHPQSPRADYVERIARAADPETELYRVGKGVGFQEFELALKDPAALGDHVLLDGFDLGGLNTHPFRNYEPLRLEEFSIVRRDPRTRWQAIPPFFARHLFEGVLTKAPGTSKEFKGTPFFPRQALHRGEWISLNHGRPEERSMYGFRLVALEEGEEMRVPISAEVPGRILLGVDRTSDASVRISVAGSDWSHEVHVGDIIRALPEFWHVHSVIGFDIDVPFEEIVISKTGGPGDLIIFAPGFRPGPAVSLY